MTGGTNPEEMAPTETRLEVRYELTERDAALAYWQALFGHPGTRRKLILAAVFAIPVLCWQLGQVGGNTSVGVTLAALIVGFCVVFPWLTGKQLGRNPAYRGPHSVWISKGGVGGTTEGVGDTRMLWRQVQAVRVTPTHILLYWKAGATTQIPKAAFVTAEAAEEFAAQAQAWQEAGGRE